jgi:hypothetical protein
MNPSAFKMEIREVEGFEDPEPIVLPIPKQYGGTLNFDMEAAIHQDHAAPNIMESTQQCISALKSMQQENISNETVSPQSTHTGDMTLTTPVNTQELNALNNTSPEKHLGNYGFNGDSGIDLAAWGSISGGVNLDDVSNMTNQSPSRLAAVHSPSFGDHFQEGVTPEEMQRVQRFEQRESDRSKLVYEKTVGHPYADS